MTDRVNSSPGSDRRTHSLTHEMTNQNEETLDPMRSIRSRAPRASSDAVRNVMKANGPRNTKPELRLRRALHAAGLRYRKYIRPELDLRCSADVVFSRRRLAVFVDGCYWHGCAKHFKPPKTNTEWWVEKTEDNIRRDARTAMELSARGWLVFRFWEHELMTRDGLAVAVEKVRSAIRG